MAPMTPHLSAQLDSIQAMRQKFRSHADHIAPHRDFQKRLRTPRNQELVTLEKVLAMANGEDFPVVTEIRLIAAASEI